MEYLSSLVKGVLIAIGGIVAVGIVMAFVFAVRARSRRPQEPGFEYVYVNDDGTARELDEDEVEYLSTDFHPADGNRPYIKSYYSDLTPDGKLRGYLRRRQLPKKTSVAPVNSD